MTATETYYRKPQAQHTPSYVDLPRDGSAAKACASCGRFTLHVNENRVCRICVSSLRVRQSGNGNGGGTPNLDAIRRGTWTPGPELRAYLAAPTWINLLRLGNDPTQPAVFVESRKDALEIAVCHGCGCVRLKPVGRLCGHAGTCEEQGRLF